MSETPDPGKPLRAYRPPWKGEVIFACSRCQRRIKKGGGPKALRKIRKWFRKRGGKESPVTVIDIPCVDLCPKGGVTIFSAQDLAQESAAVHIARTEEDLEHIYRDTTAS